MTDDDLRAVLEARASASRDDGPGRTLSDRARAVALANGRLPSVEGARVQGPSRGWRRMLGVAASVAVVVAASATALWVRPTAPDAAQDPSASPDASVVEPSPSAIPPEAWETLTWARGNEAVFNVPGRNTFVNDTIAWDGGWFAVGSAIDLQTHRAYGVMWSSRDGLEWTRVGEGWQDAGFTQVEGTAGGLVVVGVHRDPDDGDIAGRQVPAMWSSADGLTWLEAVLPLDPGAGSTAVDAAYGGRGWLLRTTGVAGNERWFVGDPVTGWDALTPAPSMFAGALLYDIRGTSDGWMAAGLTGVDPATGFYDRDPTDDQGAIWTSVDAVTWTRADIERPGTSVYTLERVDDGWIAIGDDHGGCPRCLGRPRLLWRSDDGRDWSPILIDPSSLNSFGGAQIASDGRRAVLVDTDREGRVRIRETTDGLTWTEPALRLDGSLGLPARLPFSGWAVAVGEHGIVSFFDPTTGEEDHVWMAPLRASSTPAPMDGPTQPPMPPIEDTPCLPVGDECG